MRVSLGLSSVRNDEEGRWSDAERSPTTPGSRSLRSFQKTASVEANGKIIAGRKWHPLEAEDGCALARFAGTLRSVADLLRSIRALEARWHLGAVAGAPPNQIGCGGQGRMGRERGLQRGARSPACGGGAPDRAKKTQKGGRSPRRGGFRLQ